MKNLFSVQLVRIFGIAALVAVIGFSMVACDDDPGGDPGDNPGANPALEFTLITEGNEYYDGDYSADKVETADTYRVSKGTVTSGTVVIPDTHNGKAVTSIAQQGFMETSITSVTIPNSVTYIGSSAFYNCTNLTSVIIPNNVTHIGTNAFYGCTDLTSVTIGTGVTYIGNSAFSLTGLTSITIPQSVTKIEAGAFYMCTELISVTFESASTDFNASNSFGIGDLRAEYLVGGAGTYTKTSGDGTIESPSAWTKQP